MIFKIPTLISYISKYFTLESNDIILTGTPDGFGPIRSGDVIFGSLGNISNILFTVASLLGLSLVVSSLRSGRVK